MTRPRAPQGGGHRYSMATVTGGVTAVPLLLLFGMNVFDWLQIAAFGVLLPEIRDWFGVSGTLVLTLSTASTFVTLAIAVPMGYFADRLNRTRLVGAGFALMTAVMVLTGIAPVLVFLAVARLFAGAHLATAPAQQSLLADQYPPETRPGVFSFFHASESIGKFFGPIIAGLVGGAIAWQAPFLVFAAPAAVLAVLCLVTLREPKRGESDNAVVAVEPPGFTESWRAAKGVRTLRRIWWALPFLVGAGQALLGILSLFYDEVFHISSSTRGIVTATQEPFRVAGLLLGAVVGNRVLARGRPSRVITLVGLLGALQALSLLLVAVAPTWWISVIPFYIGAFSGAVLGPSLLSLLTLVIPPRVRGFATGVAALFVAPGLLIAGPIGAVGDSWGYRWAIAATVPFFVIGALIVASAAQSVDADMRQARASAAATALGAGVEGVGGPILVVRDLDVHYGGVQVLFNVDLEVEEGEILALLGTNGAGKSTVLRAICGTTTASNGAIAFLGEDITHMPPSLHTERGIVCVPGGRAVFPTLSVREHLRLAVWTLKGQDELIDARMEEVFSFFPVLRDRIDTPAGDLSGGEQQMLALGSAFLLRPRLLMIDELSLGLAPIVVEQLLGIVRAIHAQGATVVLVEQSINVAFTIADRAVFMEKGEVRFAGLTTELLNRPDILRSVFLSGAGGGGKIAVRGRGEQPTAVLEVRSLSKRYGGIVATDDVSLTLREGRIMGLIGPNGCGKTTLFDLVSGYTEPDGGQVLLLGDDVTSLSPDARARKGLHRCFQDARLFPALTVEETVRVACEKHLQVTSATMAALHLPQVRRAERRVQRRADRLIELLQLGNVRDTFTRELSTGGRRIVDMACVLAASPTVLLLDEPAAGVAQRETEELGPLLERVRFETGCSMLIIEHDMPLLCSIADELVALEAGGVVAVGEPTAVLAHPRVVEAYLGTSEAAVNRSGPLARAARGS